MSNTEREERKGVELDFRRNSYSFHGSSSSSSISSDNNDIRFVTEQRRTDD